MLDLKIVHKGNINLTIAYDDTESKECWRVSMKEIEIAVELYLTSKYNVPFRVDAKIIGDYANV